MGATQILPDLHYIAYEVTEPNAMSMLSPQQPQFHFTFTQPAWLILFRFNVFARALSQELSNLVNKINN